MKETLIEAVRHYIVLYDTYHADYMKSKLKNEIWEKIASELKLSNGETVKTMWNKLRNCHRDALRRQKKMFKSGAGAETVRQWKFQKRMEFLLSHMENRKRSANIVDSDDERFDNADTEDRILETLPTPILENNYVLEGDNEVHSNKERDNSIEKLIDTPSSSGMKFTFKEPRKKLKKK